MQVLCKIGIVPIFKRGATLFFFLFLFSSFVFGGINNINLPHLIPDEPIPDIIIEGANYSININRTNYWDNLNSPADISLGDLNEAEQSIWDWGFIGLANITQTFVQSLGFYSDTEIDNFGFIDSETDPIYTADNITIARIGDCPSGYAVQNTTTNGVECVYINTSSTNYTYEIDGGFANSVYLASQLIDGGGA